MSKSTRQVDAVPPWAMVAMSVLHVIDRSRTWIGLAAIIWLGGGAIAPFAGKVTWADIKVAIGVLYDDGSFREHLAIGVAVLASIGLLALYAVARFQRKLIDQLRKELALTPSAE